VLSKRGGIACDPGLQSSRTSAARYAASEVPKIKVLTMALRSRIEHLVNFGNQRGRANVNTLDSQIDRLPG